MIYRIVPLPDSTLPFAYASARISLPTGPRHPLPATCSLDIRSAPARQLVTALSPVSSGGGVLVLERDPPTICNVSQVTKPKDTPKNTLQTGGWNAESSTSGTSG